MTDAAATSPSTAETYTFLDVNTFYSPRAGGIRIYCQAKLGYFAAQDLHRYVLVHPGAAFAVHQDHWNVTRIEAWGPVLSTDPRGYRFLLDYSRVFGAIRTFRPAVIEAGDPWLTGLFLMAMKALRLHRGVLVSVFHSDPVLTHVGPWAERGRCRFARRLLARLFASGFYAMQRRYDATIVSSALMERHLSEQRISAVRSPFGVPDGFLDEPMPDRTPVSGDERPVRLIYTGRLNAEKGVALLLDCLPELMTDERVHLTVLGRGPLQSRFAAFQHPRYRFLGFVEDRGEVRRIYDRHDILLAPGPFESFGLAALEGMARGLLVVGPDRGGTAELLEQCASPFVFAAGSRDDFLRKVRAAIGTDFQSYRQHARETAENYGTFREAIGRLVDFYITLAAAKSSSAAGKRLG
jgi:alpha-1,6-mannosyltransferase